MRTQGTTSYLATTSHPYKSVAYGHAPLTRPHGSAKLGRSAAHVPRALSNGSLGRHRDEERGHRIQLQAQETKRGQREGVHHADLAWCPVVLSVFKSRELGLNSTELDFDCCFLTRASNVCPHLKKALHLYKH